jgi:hypothetical protein
MQPQNLAGLAGQTPDGGCSCNHMCCVPTAEKHYNGSVNGVPNPGLGSTVSGPAALDDPVNSQTLPNRAAIEFYNAGTVVFEISNVKGFKYGDGNGRPVQPNTPYAFNIGPSTATANLHYIACASTGCDVRITEVGV